MSQIFSLKKLCIDALIFSQLYDLYSDLADFATIYIQEAHPTEAQDFVNFVDIKIHRLFSLKF